MARELSRRGESGGIFGLRDEIDRLFDNFFDFGTSPLARRGDFVPRIELRETDQAYLVRAELPGLKAEDVSIEVEGNVLTVRGERKREEQKKQGGFEYSESSYGSFVRAVQLPNAIDSSKVEAKIDQGILEVSVPKSATAQSRKIPVRSAGEQLTPGPQQQSGGSATAASGAKPELSQAQRGSQKQ